MRRKMSVSSGRTYHLGIRRERRAGPRSCAWCAALGAIVVLVGLAGCGTNIEAVLAQTGNAAATTLFDALLTDFANSVADNLDQNAPRPVDGADEDGGDGGDDGDGGDEGGDGVDGGLDGTAMFADDCAACHGDDGASGFAPDITGVDAAALSTGLESGAHSGIALTDEEVAAIAEFLGG